MDFEFMAARIVRYLFDAEVKVCRTAAKVEDAISCDVAFFIRFQTVRL